MKTSIPVFGYTDAQGVYHKDYRLLPAKWVKCSNGLRAVVVIGDTEYEVCPANAEKIVAALSAT